jgi:bZIP transcription factor.
MHCLNTKRNPPPQDRPTGQPSSESSNSRMSSPYPQSPSSVSPGPASSSSSSSSSSNVVSSSSRLQQSRDQHTKTYASSSSSSTSIRPGAQAAVHQNKYLMHSSTQVPDPILSFQQCSSLNSTSQPPVSSTSQGTAQNETENIGLTRKESRSFSFQLCEATHDCQNLTFSPEKKMTQGDVSKEEQSQRQGGNEITDRKEKRLQRNRESARLSRRRRKQYLEVLENRVNYLCEEMDKGRREHVLSAIGQIEKLRNDLLVELEQNVLPVKKEHDDMEDLNQLDGKIEKLVNGGVLSRSSTELMLAVTFGKQYLKSLVIPPFKKYVMWLTLQNELFFRGGRAASERLSAARIGDKVCVCMRTDCICTSDFQLCFHVTLMDLFLFPFVISCSFLVLVINTFRLPMACGLFFVMKLHYPMTKKRKCVSCNEKLCPIKKRGCIVTRGPLPNM